MHKNFILLILVLFFVSGCGIKDKDVLTQREKVTIMKDGMLIANDKELNVSTQNNLESTISSLATQIMTNKKIDTAKPVLITSFVRLDQFKTTSEFGRIVGESLIDELSIRGFNIIEFRGQMAVSVNAQGEYFLSRKPYDLKNEAPSTYIVVGTYSRQQGKVILNARIIDNITGKVISSARATYIHNLAHDCVLFKDCAPLRTVNIVEEK